MLKISANELPPNHQFNGIDLAKFVCAIFVFMIHIRLFPGNSSVFLQYIESGLRQTICRVAVPYYFVSSGFLLFRKTDFNNLDDERIRKYCFKMLRLLGTWTFLLFVGGKYHLWYLGATVLAVIVLSYFLKRGIPLHHILIIALCLYCIGLLGNSYYGLMEPLKKISFLKVFILGYEKVFSTTGNGLFFGFIFVSMGALFSQKRIVLTNTVAFGGLIVSSVMLMLEVIMLKRYSHPKDYQLLVLLLPVVFFLFYISTHMNLKSRPIYSVLRTVGMAIYFTHLFVEYWVLLAIKITKNRVGIDLTAFQFLLTLCCTILLAFLLVRLQRRKRFHWIKYLFS